VAESNPIQSNQYNIFQNKNERNLYQHQYQYQHQNESPTADDDDDDNNDDGRVYIERTTYYTIL